VRTIVFNEVAEAEISLEGIIDLPSPNRFATKSLHRKIDVFKHLVIIETGRRREETGYFHEFVTRVL
jgi:hypothetical protein